MFHAHDTAPAPTTPPERRSKQGSILPFQPILAFFRRALRPPPQHESASNPDTLHVLRAALTDQQVVFAQFLSSAGSTFLEFPHLVEFRSDELLIKTHESEHTLPYASFASGQRVRVSGHPTDPTIRYYDVRLVRGSLVRFGVVPIDSTSLEGRRRYYAAVRKQLDHHLR